MNINVAEMEKVFIDSRHTVCSVEFTVQDGGHNLVASKLQNIS